MAVAVVGKLKLEKIHSQVPGQFVGVFLLPGYPSARSRKVLQASVGSWYDIHNKQKPTYKLYQIREWTFFISTC